MREDRGDEAAVRRRRAPVVQEEDPLADAPQRRGAELVAARATLLDMVRELGAQVMEREIGRRWSAVRSCIIAEMRGLVLFVIGIMGCSSAKNPGTDANTSIDSAGDIDAGCQPKMLLVGGSDVTAQGWSTVMQPPATLSYGTDFVSLQTSTNAGATTGGQLLLNYPGALEVGNPFRLQVVMLVESVSPHNPSDSAAAIMASFSSLFGTANERSQMVYLDSNQVGWADNMQSFPVSVTNNAYHTYELSVDANNVARFSVDGTPALMRSGFVSNGAIAIGDQTNEPNIDSALRIRSVTKLCP
jgi:hypothetical protein